MKKFYLVFLLLGVFAGLVSSCSDDDCPIETTSPLANITSENLSLHIGDSVVLKATTSSLLETTYSWMLDSTEVSTTATYTFKAEYSGTFKINLTANNTEGALNSTTTIIVQPGKYKNGTFVLSENSSLLTFISPEGRVTGDAYTDVNGTKLGSVNQDIFIYNHKMYIVSQNGGNDGYLVITNAETLKKEKGFQDELKGKVTMPTHVAVLGDDDIYLNDQSARGKGVKLFHPSTGEVTTIEGTSKTLKKTMAVANGKLFVAADNQLLVIEKGKNAITTSIEFEKRISGVIKSSDKNVWVADEGGNISKVDAQSFAILQTNELSDEGAKKAIGSSVAASPSITAKGDTLYMSGLSSKIYRHIFSTEETKLMVDAKDYVENVGIIYNTCAVHPLSGEVYLNSIKGYGLDYLINNISVFDFSGNEPKLSANYKDYTAFPAGTFFTYNFE